jgi:type IV pilus assembly protein PilA
MRRISRLFILLVFATGSAFSQSYPDVEALVESIFAKDVTTLSQHLPESFHEQLQQLSADEREALGRDFLVAERMRGEGASIARGERSVLVEIEAPKNSSEAGRGMQLILDKRISDGHESVLLLSVRNKPEDAEQKRNEMQVWMRFEGGSWRIAQVLAVRPEVLLSFEDEKLISEFRQRRLGANESSAVGSVRTINTACITYATMYAELGFPANLDVLGGEGTRESTAEHSLLLDRTMTTQPYIKSGYRFTYRSSGSASPIAAYTVVARPVQYGTTGKRSFFSDESGVIRFTSEDREPTASDPPLQ